MHLLIRRWEGYGVICKPPLPAKWKDIEKMDYGLDFLRSVCEVLKHLWQDR